MTPEEAREEIKRRGLPPTRAEWARQELVKRGLPTPIPQKSIGNKAYDFAQETVPYIAGGLGGAAGAPIGGAPAIVGAGLGYAGAKTGLRGLGKLLGYEKQNTLGQETKQTALKDLPVGMAMEEVPPVMGKIINSQLAKKTGEGLAEMFGSIPGVDTERIMALANKPKSLLPRFLGGPPPVEESGQIIGRYQKELGLPDLVERRSGYDLMGVKPPSGMEEGTVKIHDPERAYDPDVLAKMKSQLNPRAQAELDKAMAEMKVNVGKSSPENDRQVAARVIEGIKKGQMPDIKETIPAMRGIDEKIQNYPSDMTDAQKADKMLNTQYRKQLNEHLGKLAPQLQKARGNYAEGMTRKAFTSPAFGLLAQSGGKDVSRMGANKFMGPFALTRMATNPAFGALLGASQSPLVLGAGTAGLGAAAQAAQSPITARAIQSLLETIRRKKQGPQGTQQ